MARRERGPTPAWEREFNRRLGCNIAAARKTRGLNAAQFARQLGVDPPRLWRWEHGRTIVGLNWLQRIADALGVTGTSLLPPTGDLAL